MSLDINEVKKGITSLALGTNSFKTAIESRFYFEEAPQGTQYPYAVFSFFSNTNINDSTDNFETIGLQISIYDDNSSSLNIGDLENKARLLFDNSEKNLLVTGAYVYNVRRVSVSRLKDDAWQSVISYLVKIQTGV